MSMLLLKKKKQERMKTPWEHKKERMITPWEKNKNTNSMDISGMSKCHLESVRSEVSCCNGDKYNVAT